MINNCKKHGEYNGFSSDPCCIRCLSEAAFKNEGPLWPSLKDILPKPIKKLAKCGRGSNFKDGFIRRVSEK